MIKVIYVGAQNKDLIDFEENLIKRIKKFQTIELIEIKQSDKKTETQKLIEKINAHKKDFELYILDIGAKQHSSHEFESIVFQKDHLDTIFVIGGAFGFEKPIFELKHKKIGLSKMTFTHQIAKILLLEQIYRINTIKNNIPYHK